MLPTIPFHLVAVFLLTTALTYFLIVRAVLKTTVFSRISIIGLLSSWLVFQGILGYLTFYTEGLFAFPPRFALTILPPLMLLVILFNTVKGKTFLDQLNVVDLTWVSIVRIPVEFVLLGLALEKAIPLNMTFEGWNFDLWSGVTAPVIAIAFLKGKLTKPKLLLWNGIALMLLVAVVGQAILSVPSSFQQFAYDQPNIGVLYFPFNWLPSFIVPVVFFCHFASIRQLLKKT